jgi:hypothetical protein
MFLLLVRFNNLRESMLALMLCSAVALTACGSDVTSPSQQPLSLTGTWVGSHKFASCTGGVDFRTCSRLVGQTGTLKLTLSQAGGSITGTLTVDVIAPSSTENAFLTTIVVPVTGTASADGMLRLSGAATIDRTNLGLETANVTTTLSTTDMGGQLATSITGYSSGFGFLQTFAASSDVRLTKQS